jgi:hypothetical protein
MESEKQTEEWPKAALDNFEFQSNLCMCFAGNYPPSLLGPIKFLLGIHT